MTFISALWTRIRRPGTSLPSRGKVYSHGQPFQPFLDQLEARVVPAQVMQPASLGAGSLVVATARSGFGRMMVPTRHSPLLKATRVA